MTPLTSESLLWFTLGNFAVNYCRILLELLRGWMPRSKLDPRHVWRTYK